MNNEDFFDIIGDIDDDIISDAMFPVRKKRGNIRRIITVSAAVFIFLLGGLLIKNGFFNTEYILPAENTTEDEATVSDSLTEDFFTEKHSVTAPTETQACTQEQTSETKACTEEQTSEIFIPPSGEVIEETTTEKNDTVIFNETDIMNLIYKSTNSVPDGFPVSEKADIFTLEKIYGTSIIPSYLPVIFSGNSVQNIEEKYNVYYNEDKTEVFCDNTFIYILKSGNILSVKASTDEIPTPDTDIPEEAVSYINNIPVNLYKANDGLLSTMLSAYFVKDGCFFNITMSGISPDETEFIKITESLIKKHAASTPRPPNLGGENVFF